MAKVKTIPVLINFSKQDLVRIDKIVKEGFYASRTEAVRDAVRFRIDELLTGTRKGLKKTPRDELEQALADYVNEDPHDRLRKLGL